MDEDKNDAKKDATGKEKEYNPKTTSQILPVAISREMKKAYLDYSMSVIVGRALPDVRDGLKPVHRRVLFAMHELGLASNKPHKKSARVVGEVLGKYHPHGDTAVYDTIVRMAQNFSLNHTLVDGHGNFGSIDGDSAAAMRYTEVRMAKIAEEMLKDIDMETVNFSPNFDDTLKEPVVLPSMIPNLLVNGSEGIAVGMATKIPPHNLREIIDATVILIDNPETTADDFAGIVKGPDFPTAGRICGRSGIISAYRSGRGKVNVRAVAEVEEKNDKLRIIITELPYQVNKANLIKNMAHLANDKKVEGIRDLRDESDREGMRVVIELTKTATPEIVLNQLYKHTDMSITYGMINLALVDNQPRVLTLPQILQCYIDHRFEVVTRRTEYLLKKAKERAHILEGLRIALENIDETIKIIKSSKNREEAHERLTERFGLSKIQIDAILAMQLQRLTGLEREKIDNEYKELLAKIEEYTAILADRMKVLAIIKKELLEIRDKYGRDRLTKIEDAAEGEMDDEAFIEKENVTIAITNTGYIKRMSQDEFKAQRRGGKGVIGMATKEEDHIKDIFTANTHDYLLFFTSTGQVRWLKVYQIPEGTRYSKGRAVTNLLNLHEGEEVCAILRSNNFDDEHFIMMATKKGVVKKTPASAFAKPRKGGIRGITLRDGDMLVEVRETDGTRDILIPTREGKAIRFNEKDVRSMGRTAAGVRGIRLSKGDKVIGMTILDPEKAILTVTQKGYGKRTAIDDYRITRRGGKGIINLQVTDKTGKIVDSRAVRETEEILLVSKQGKIIRTNLSQIKVQGRNTQGVRIMRLDDKDVLAAVGRVIADAEPTDDADKEDAVDNTNNTTVEKDDISGVIPSENKDE